MNNQIVFFDAQKLENLRQKASSSWMDQLSEDLEIDEGWTVSTLNLQAFMAEFAPSLTLKSGLILRAYQFISEGRDGEARVYAIPENLPFPELDFGLFDLFDDEPPPPFGSLNNIMEAIEGDFSPWSYLCASLFAREISEVGAFGHGSHWVSFRILDQNPWTDPKNQLTGTMNENPWTDPTNHLTGTINEWEWLEAQPSHWKPSVCVENHQITVQFYTYSGLGGQTINRHIDRYIPNSYVFESSTTNIAINTLGGYVW